MSETSPLPARFSGFDDSPWLGGATTRLGAAMEVPSMLTHEETLLYHWLTSTWASGSGAIVDLGCFVGGSTARLAEGHRQAGLNSPIHAYDKFGVSQSLCDEVLYPAGVTPFEAEDSLPAVRQLLAPWLDHITLHKGDIAELGWSGAPIEILAMDASKSTRTMDQMALDFFPALIAGQSILIQQDFMHWRQPWIAAQMARLSEYFVPLAHALDDTVVFGCVKTPDRDAVRAALVDPLSDDDLLAAVEAAEPIYAEFGALKQMRHHLKAIKHNPGKRVSWQLDKP